MQAVQIVLFVVVSALALAVVAYLVVPRLRARTRPEPPPREARTPVAEPPRASPSGRMFCPACRREYPAGLKYCPTDSRALIPAAQAASGRSLAAGVTCPTCRRSFDAGKKFCPYDADELTPPALAGTSGGRMPMRVARIGRESGISIPVAIPIPMLGKICPSCAQRYDSEATFCGRDGSELVSVN